jgi:HD-like signal output (HDOD) protein
VEISERLESSESPLEDIAEVVGRDIGMTAKLLKLVNSAFFGLYRQIADAREAVSYLGIDTLKSLVLTLHVFSEFEETARKSVALGRLWIHSTQTAAAARVIALAENAGARQVSEAFTAGLLHDCGKLVLAGNFGAQYGEVIRLASSQPLSLVEAERQIFGANHAEVGGYLLGLWGLPVPIVEAIAHHHDPSHGPSRAFSPLTAVHVGDVLANEGEPTGFRKLPGPPVDLCYLRELGVETRLPEWRALVTGAGNEREAA